MTETEQRRSISVRVMAALVFAAGGLTWLCVGWVGSQGPLTAAVAVLLVELFLACFVAIGMLLAARVSESYMLREARVSDRAPRKPRPWLWRPLWLPSGQWSRRVEPLAATCVPVGHWLDAVHHELRPLNAPGCSAETIPFHTPEAVPPVGDPQPGKPRLRRRRAA